MNRRLTSFVLILLGLVAAWSCSREVSRDTAEVSTDCCESVPTGTVVTVDVASTDSTTRIYVGPGQWLKWMCSRSSQTVQFDRRSEALFGIAEARILCVGGGACVWTRVLCSAQEGTSYATMYAGEIKPMAGPIIIVCPPGKDCSPDTTSSVPR